MLLRGIAFAEARRNSARRVFKNRDKTQSNNGCERDVASDLSYDGPLTRHMRTMTMMVRQSPEQPLSPVSPLPFESEAISFVATASKLATVEDVGPKRPEGPIRPSAASLKVSPTARATLQAIRSPKSKLVIPVSTRDAETITGLNEDKRAGNLASGGREIMYLGGKEMRRPKGPAKLKGILEKRDAILSKWRDDVCSGEELPEVEIISLLEEQIPRYRLRADTLTQFQGYENADWFIPSPALKSEDVDLKLSPDQIRETLNYFIFFIMKIGIPELTFLLISGNA
ncbi:Trafficking kinesin-binding protein 1 [Camponotus floridanus]|uniref:Trafficking kinesin-binding protein 1 n=1 Tax=Camponotus floridanus TaxID=104421 RepID=E2A3Z2_CAMFO|nr:Trafficking kinesin-binding protein 1 [Camponotus floridanus]